MPLVRYGIFSKALPGSFEVWRPEKKCQAPGKRRRLTTPWVVALALSVTFCCSARAGGPQDSTPGPAAGTALSKGTLELSLAAGYTYTFRRTDAHVTKLRGAPVILGVGVVATDPIGKSWYQGQVTLGGEVAFIQYVEPLTTYLASVTPTVKYTFLASDRLRPYVEAGAGVVWTDLGDRIPEQGSQFNFNLQAGIGLAYFITPAASINASYRFQHISNAGTAHPNSGIDAGVVLIGISKLF
jgi:lipid A 3-O-deacylase